MTAADVERILRSVVKQYGVSCKLLRVSPLEGAWEVVLVPRDGPTIHLTIPASSAHAVRRSLMTALQVDG